MNTNNKITTVQKSSLRGKQLLVSSRSTERFIITQELIGGRVIALCNNGQEYCFDLTEDVTVIHN